MSSNVYGPYDHASWITMLMLKEDNRNMIQTDRNKYDLAIKRNTNCLRDFFTYRMEAA